MYRGCVHLLVRVTGFMGNTVLARSGGLVLVAWYGNVGLDVGCGSGDVVLAWARGTDRGDSGTV